MKAKDCPECGPHIRLMQSVAAKPYGNNPAFQRRVAKHSVKYHTRLHGNFRIHNYNYDYEAATWVKGCGRRQLIHKGGKP